ncbi:hypothetical protein [Bradyrhizobium betae]|uniref:hypothetical protein n=1 Tax=Bradyrhizobium betae TaxID=244734 RepID=UPI00100FC0A4|nr:hypothetical protein [Bradyrhizobium betae]
MHEIPQQRIDLVVPALAGEAARSRDRLCRRRGTKREVANDEIRSPVRALDYQPPVREYREVSPDHVVQIWGEERSA